MKKVLVIMILAFCFSTSSFARDYTTGIGLRGGVTDGFTIKHFIKDKVAIDGILAVRWGGLNITGLYEIHDEAFNNTNLTWYYGVGGHVGFWRGEKVSWGDDGENYTVIGVDAVIGLEYYFKKYPVTIGVDWKPTLNLIGYTGFWGEIIAMSVRYAF